MVSKYSFKDTWLDVGGLYEKRLDGNGCFG